MFRNACLRVRCAFRYGFFFRDNFAGFGIAHQGFVVPGIQRVLFKHLFAFLFRVDQSNFLHEGDEEPEGQKRAGRQEKDRHRREPRAEDLDAACSIRCREQCAGTEKLPDSGDERQCQREAESHGYAVHQGRQRWIFGGKGFRAGKDDTVDYNQRNEQSERRVDGRQIRLDEQLYSRHETGDDHDIRRDAHLFRDDFAHKGDKEIGKRQNNGGRQSHAERVHNGCGGRQRRTHTEELYEGRVLGENPVFQLFEILIRHFAPPFSSTHRRPAR